MKFREKNRRFRIREKHVMNSIIDVMEILLENGADANIADKNGSTLLMGASINGHLPTIKFLIKQGTRNCWV